MGGQGKSMLLLRCARNTKVLKAFPKMEQGQVNGGVLWIDVGRASTARRLLEQTKCALRLRIDEDEELDREAAIKRRIADLDVGKFLVCLDNVWSDSTDAVQQLLGAFCDGITVICSTRESEVVQSLELDSEINLAELSPKDAESMLRRQCPNVEMDDDTARAFTQSCGMHLLALSIIGNTLRLMCRDGTCTPQDVLSDLEQHRDKILKKREIKLVEKHDHHILP